MRNQDLINDDSNRIAEGVVVITGAIKNKVDKIWTDIWAGGITNPLTVIEQLTYLMLTLQYEGSYHL